MVDRIPPDQPLPYNPTHEVIIKVVQTVTVYDTEGNSEYTVSLTESATPRIPQWGAVYMSCANEIASAMPGMVEAIQLEMVKRA